MMSDDKQTRKFILRYIVFFNKDKLVNLRKLGRKATHEEIMEADGATLRFVNNKIGEKNACINHEKNGELYVNLVGALGRWCVHLRNNRAKIDCLVSELFDKRSRQDIKNDNMSKALRLEAVKLA